MSDGSRCGYATQDEMRAYRERKQHRIRLDLRGKTLTPYPHSRSGAIAEIEEGLLAEWRDYQNQPDEIVVDSLLEYTTTMLAMNPDLIQLTQETLLSSCRYAPVLRSYPSKWAISATPEWIPVFETV